MLKKHAIAASSLTKDYQIKTNWLGKTKTISVLRDISFTLLEGETLGILGESGSGKSTLAKLLVGEENATSGLLLIDSKDVTNISTQKRLTNYRKVRMVYQNPYASLNPGQTIYRLLEEPLKNITRLNHDERKELILKILSLVGLKSEHGRRLPHMFSPGERQRIAFARALILDPVCIVFDEPLTSLDISVQSQIVNLMLQLQKDLDLSYVLISHSIPVLKHMCDQLMVLCQGQMVEYGPAKSLFDNPKHPYTKDLLSNTPGTESEQQSKDGCIYSSRCENVSENCMNAKPTQRLIDDHIVCCFKAE